MCDYRGDIVAGNKIKSLLVADIDTRAFSIRDKIVTVEEFLPCLVPYIRLSLFRIGLETKEFKHAFGLFNVLLEIDIRN